MSVEAKRIECDPIGARCAEHYRRESACSDCSLYSFISALDAWEDEGGSLGPE
jgi:hypothetical protein